MKNYILFVACVFCIASCKKDSNTNTNNNNNNNVKTDPCKTVTCYHASLCDNGYCYCNNFALGAHCDTLLLSRYYRTYYLSCGFLTIDTPTSTQDARTAMFHVSVGGAGASQLVTFSPLGSDSTYEGDFTYSTTIDGAYTQSVGGRITIYMPQKKTTVAVSYSNNFPPGSSAGCDSTFNY